MVNFSDVHKPSKEIRNQANVLLLIILITILHACYPSTTWTLSTNAISSQVHFNYYLLWTAITSMKLWQSIAEGPCVISWYWLENTKDLNKNTVKGFENFTTLMNSTFSLTLFDPPLILWNLKVQTFIAVQSWAKSWQANNVSLWRLSNASATLRITFEPS